MCVGGLEEAGYNNDAYPGLIGVYGGSDQRSYLYQIYSHGTRYFDVPMASIGNDKDYPTTQVSYRRWFVRSSGCRRRVAGNGVQGARLAVGPERI